MQLMKNLMTKAAVGLSMLSMPFTAGAQGLKDAKGGIEEVGTALNAGGVNSTTTLPGLIGNLINVVLSVMGILFVLLIVYAGILYMQAGANPDNAKKAKGLIINAIIGLVIVIASYAISTFIIDQLVNVAK